MENKGQHRIDIVILEQDADIEAELSKKQEDENRWMYTRERGRTVIQSKLSNNTKRW